MAPYFSYVTKVVEIKNFMRACCWDRAIALKAIAPCKEIRDWILHHVRKSKTVLDFGFYAMDSGFQVLDSILFSVTLIMDSIIGGIPDSLSCIPDSKAQDSGLNNQNFHRFRDSISKYLPVFPYIGRKQP